MKFSLCLKGASAVSLSLLALVGEKFVNIRVPCAMGFFGKCADGRIDDPAAG